MPPFLWGLPTAVSNLLRCAPGRGLRLGCCDWAVATGLLRCAVKPTWALYPELSFCRISFTWPRPQLIDEGFFINLAAFSVGLILGAGLISHTHRNRNLWDRTIQPEWSLIGAGASDTDCAALKDCGLQRRKADRVLWCLRQNSVGILLTW